MEKIISEFDILGEVISFSQYGSGHVNDTLLVKTTLERYILQSINTNAFKNVAGLMNNIINVTRHIERKIISRGENPTREVLKVIPTRNGENYLKVNNDYYRMYLFIDGIAYQWAETLELFFESAVAFGDFFNMLADFDATELMMTIPDFHNTTVRFDNFIKSIKIDRLKRAESVKADIQKFLNRKAYCDRIVNLLDDGKMPLRVTHNDTKLNNVLFDPMDNKCIAVIDLDTVMPGSMCYDFGDSIRFGCNPAGEDERDLSKVVFRMDLFKQYAKGFLSEVYKSITEIELSNLSFSAILMTYECGMRFLTDHIDGDIYFRIDQEGQNLDRARTQMKLVEDMEQHLPKMNEVIRTVYKEYKSYEN